MFTLQHFSPRTLSVGPASSPEPGRTAENGVVCCHRPRLTSIDNDLTSAHVQSLLRFNGRDDLEAYPVSTIVNSPKNDVEESTEKAV